MALSHRPLRDRVRLRFAFSAYALSLIPNAVLPWTISALADEGMSVVKAGQLVTIQLSVLALFAVGGSVIVNRLNKLGVMVTAVIMMVIASAAISLNTGSFGILILLMSVIAASAGLSSAVGIGVLSQADDGNRMTAQLWTATLIWEATLWQVTPIVAAHFGTTGLNVLIACAAAFLLLLIPGYRNEAAISAAADGAVDPATHLRRPAFMIVALLVVVAFGFWFRDSLAWSLADIRAIALDVDGAKLSITLLVASLLAIAAPAAASWAGRRFNRGLPLVLGMLAVSIVMTGIAASTAGFAYLGFYSLWTFTSTFAWTLLIQIAVSADSSGRTAALTGSMLFVGAAVGPVTGGILLGDGSSQGPVMAGVSLLSLLVVGCSWGITAMMRRRSRASDIDMGERESTNGHHL